MYQNVNREQIEIITKEVTSILQNEQSGHGMDHIHRVLNLSLKFAQKEQADTSLVTIIALLHDVDDHKLVGEKQALTAKNSRFILEKANIDFRNRELIIKEIQSIGYSHALKGIRPTTLEGQIVSDADMCDALGAHGILRTYAYGQKNNRPFFDNQIFPTEIKEREDYVQSKTTSICHFFEKLLKLKKLMLTQVGKETSKARHQLMIEFLYQYFDEEDNDEWKKYLDHYLLNSN